MKKEIIVTHNGGFHADDCFAVATILLHLKKDLGEVEIIRTRDPELIQKGDFVVDVGAEHDPSRRRFDHHQEGGAGRRGNGIPYASFGLVWKEYGLSITGSDEAWRMIEQYLVSPIDANDNGTVLSKPVIGGISTYGVHNVLLSFVPEGDVDDEAIKEYFLEATEIAYRILKNEVRNFSWRAEMKEKILKAYEASSDKRLIILDESKGWSRPFIGTALSEFPEPVFYIRERSDGHFQLVAIEKGNFVNRKDLPDSWAGKKDEELQKITGVSDAIFCHNGRFMCVAGSKEGALKLAKQALAG